MSRIKQRIPSGADVRPSGKTRAPARALVALLRYTGQAVCYALFIVVIGYFSTSPAVVQLAPTEAAMKISLTHAGQIKEPCRQRSAEELARLAPNMRIPMECTRERSAVEVDVELDGRSFYHATLAPAGLSHDGASSAYRRFRIPSGEHIVRARLKDHIALPDFNYTKTDRVDLKPGQVLVIDFDARRGGFEFR